MNNALFVKTAETTFLSRLLKLGESKNCSIKSFKSSTETKSPTWDLATKLVAILIASPLKSLANAVSQAPIFCESSSEFWSTKSLLTTALTKETTSLSLETDLSKTLISEFKSNLFCLSNSSSSFWMLFKMFWTPLDLAMLSISEAIL